MHLRPNAGFVEEEKMKTVIAANQHYCWRIISITKHRSCSVDCVCRMYKLQYKNDFLWATVSETKSVAQVNHWKSTYDIDSV